MYENNNNRYYKSQSRKLNKNRLSFGRGSRIRTCGDGVRVRCLTTWRYPNKTC